MIRRGGHAIVLMMFLAAIVYAADPPSTRPATVVRIGTASVRITSAALDRVKLHARTPGTDDPDTPDRKFLLVRLELTNLGPGDLSYRTYNGSSLAGRDHASLRDSPKHYVTLLDFGDYEPEGVTRTATIAAGHSITDTLVFDVPADTTDLVLLLPQGNLGGAGRDRLLGVKLP